MSKPKPPEKSNDLESEPKMIATDPKFQWSLLVVASCCIAAAFGHAIWPERITQTTAMFLALGAAVLVIPQVTRIQLPGGTIVEKIATQQRSLQRKLKQVDNKIDVIEHSGLLPGSSPTHFTNPKPILRDVPNSRKAPGSSSTPNPADPNKRKYGGKPEANERILRATMMPANGEDSAACRIYFWVESTNPQNPLSGTVHFYLHPTFNKWAEYDVECKNGVASDTITSWGAFTIGAVLDDGKTSLELDLMDVDGGTKKFYTS